MTPDERQLYELFQQLLESADSDTSLSDVLLFAAGDARPELEGMLGAAEDLRAHAAPPPDPSAALARARERVLAAIPSQPNTVARPALALVPPATPPQQQRRTFRFPAQAWALAAAAVLLVIVLSSLTLPSVSKSALPGDLLYPVKRLSEKVAMATTLDPERRKELADAQKAERSSEVAKSLELGREDVPVEYEGELQIGPNNEYVVEGIVIDPGQQEDALTQLTPGMVVTIRGRTGAGVVVLEELLPPQTPSKVTPPPTPVPDTSGVSPRQNPTATRRPGRPPPRDRATPTPQPKRPTPERSPTPEATAVPDDNQPAPTATPNVEASPTREKLRSVEGILSRRTDGQIVVGGTTYRLGDVNAADIEPGSLVRITFRVSEGVRVATELVLLEEPDAPERIKLRGMITGLTDGVITIQGDNILINGQTQIVGGPLQVGAYVLVTAQSQDGVIIANRIVVRDSNQIEIEGEIQRVRNKTIVVAGRTINIAAATVRGGRVRVGRWAQVSGTEQPNGVIKATLVIVQRPPDAPPPTDDGGSTDGGTVFPTPGDDGVTPTDTPAPDETPTLEPATPTVDTPVDTPDAPTETPRPATDTPEPRPTDTPEPPTNTPKPDPTDTPRPEPTNTPKPPEPTDPPRPTPVPPTDTPVPPPPEDGGG